MRRVWLKRIIVVLFAVVAEVISIIVFWQVNHVGVQNMYILSFEQKNKGFTSIDISNMESGDICISYSYERNEAVSNGRYEQEMTVIATNGNYAFFVNIEMLKGTFFNEKQEEKKQRVAVLNKLAANGLFGNIDCIGEMIYLDEVTYEVIGIADTAGKDSVVMIPYVVSEEINKQQGGILERVWCNFENIAEAAFRLGSSGISYDELKITQMDLCKRVWLLRVLFPIVLVLVWIFIICSRKIADFLRSDKDSRYNWSWWTFLIRWFIVIGVDLVAIICIFPSIWCVPPYYKVAQKSGLELIYSIIDFYTLSDAEINAIPFWHQCNMISGLSLIFVLWELCRLIGDYGKNMRMSNVKGEEKVNEQIDKRGCYKRWVNSNMIK